MKLLPGGAVQCLPTTIHTVEEMSTARVQGLLAFIRCEFNSHGKSVDNQTIEQTILGFTSLDILKKWAI